MTQPDSTPRTIRDLARAIYERPETKDDRSLGPHRWDNVPDDGRAFYDELARAVVLALADDIEAEVWPGQDGLDTPAGRLSTLIAECREGRP
jgi:hypothetical protein